jgi:RNA polymerase sigma factor (TIGR02999 family)
VLEVAANTVGSGEPGTGITQLLDRIRGGDRAALDVLVPLVYGELHRLAADQMHRDRFSITLQPTALINEAFLRLFGKAVPSFNDRSHFLGIVSHVMRQVLVDHARRRQAQKRGSGLQVSLEGVEEKLARPPVDLLSINDVLERLGREDPRLLTLIEMRFFGGMTAEETAAALGESVNAVRHDIRYALACLRRDLDPTREKK